MKSTTNSAFAKDVLESKKTVLLDVWAPWCAPCRGMEPTLNTISEETKDWAEIVKVDASVEEDLVQQLGVSGLPTFLVFKGGQMVGSSVGAASKTKLLDLMSK
ncbi:thiol reductase thioredoxin [Candidatus Saccharibacteria bacterium HGW-Saccharibacteria-1]|jgi:thioredoxin 1|nr:MAG: thiol reductase thioredoxin [Candidatus Saccharibacteria bacterium HGW-Saccharibacteria-1]